MKYVKKTASNPRAIDRATVLAYAVIALFEAIGVCFLGAALLGKTVQSLDRSAIFTAVLLVFAVLYTYLLYRNAPAADRSETPTILEQFDGNFTRKPDKKFENSEIDEKKIIPFHCKNETRMVR